jgi:signal transduction histidine kinase/CheY-like chemotaxis protein/PAS domain-containing protein
VTAATVVTILMLFLLHATSDHARSVQQDLATKRSIAELVVQQTQAVLTGADGAIAALRAGSPAQSPALPLVSGIRSIRLVPADQPRMAVPVGTVLEDRVVTNGTATRPAITLDTDWLARRYAELSDGTRITVALLDTLGRPTVQSGADAILDARGRPLGRCLCVVMPVPGRSFTVVAGSPRMVAMQPWQVATGRLAIGTLLIIALLLALSLRLERLEGREARRLAHLSASIARLSQQLDRASLFRQLEADSAVLVDRHATCVVLSEGVEQGVGGSITAGCDSFSLLTREGCLEGLLLVTLKKRRRLEAIERFGLEQLVYSASHMLDVIQLLEERRAEVEKVTALHRIADQSRRQIEAVFSAMPDAVLAVDEAWRPIFANIEARTLLCLGTIPPGGGPANSPCGSFWALFPPTVLEQIEAPLRQAAATQSEMSCAIRWPGGAGVPERYFAMRGVGHGSGTTLSLQDISRQIAADAQDRQVAKMEAIGLLTGGIAHDFNNLLTVIMGNLELLQIDDGGSGHDSGSIEDAFRAARSAADLVHQLLAFARKQPLAPRLVDVAQLLREMNGLLKSSAGPLIGIAVQVDCPSCHALIDPTQLQNALINLAVNARDAMADGGTLTIRLAATVITDDGASQTDGLQPGDYVRIDVSDTGHGVAPEHLSHVFEPFFTTKPSGAGTGLGLSMVYGFVKQSRGHVGIVSAPGTGTTITLYLPRSQDSTGNNPAPVAAALQPPPGHGETILLVEDVDLVRSQTARMLRRLHYVVIEAADARQALSAVTCGASPDLLLSDIELPGGINGPDLAQRLNIMLPDMPVLFASGYAHDGLLSRNLIEPGRNLLQKPFTFYQLGSQVLHAVKRTVLDATESH